MFKKAHLNFFLISIGVLFYVLAGISFFFHTFLSEKEKSDRDFDLVTMLENVSDIHGPKSFIVYLKNDEPLKMDFDASFYTSEEILNILSSIKEKGLKPQEEIASNRIGHIYYKIKYNPSYDTYFIVGVNREVEASIIQYSLILLLIIETAVFAALSTVLWYSSKWVVRPLELSNARQKRFISDASHELKTPLTIISTSAEVLKNDLDDNKWISTIQDQVQHLSNLINQLLALSIIDEKYELVSTEEFDFSSFLNLAILPYESLAFEKGISFEINIEPKIKINGNKEALKQLIGIFMDNALKYCSENGTIKVHLEKNKRIKLTFYNTGSDIPDDNKEILFERFYRSDESRNSERKGFGLGLSIASRLCELYNYQIKPESKYNEFTSFTIFLTEQK